LKRQYKGRQTDKKKNELEVEKEEEKRTYC
jgi:hypothetical protein